MNSSIECPRCGSAISRDEIAGEPGNRAGQPPSQMLRCEKCGNEVLDPSSAAATAGTDDDDWLNLDNTPVPTPTDTSKPANSDPPPFHVDGVEIVEVDDFDGLGEFKIPGDAERPADFEGVGDFEGLTEFQGPGDFDSLGDVSGMPATPPTSGKPIDQEFRLRCPVCDSVMFVQPAQEGSMVICSDCRSEVTVPAPPKPKTAAPSFSPGPASFNTSIPPSIPFAAAPPKMARPEDPFRKNASDLLEEASRVEVEKPDDDFTVPSVSDWIVSVLKVMTDIGVVAHFAIFSVAGSVAGMAAFWTQHPALVLFLFPAGVLFALVVLSCAFAILQSSANDRDHVEDWPTSDPGVWLENALCTAAAAVISGLPALALTSFIFGANLATVAMTMFSIFALFPFVLLSILDHGSVMMPFSAEVARSLQTTKEPWGGMYFSSALLFAGLFFLFIIMGMADPVVATPVIVTATVAAIFVYFAMIGRLAFAIGQYVRDDKPVTPSTD